MNMLGILCGLWRWGPLFSSVTMELKNGSESVFWEREREREELIDDNLNNQVIVNDPSKQSRIGVSDKLKKENETLQRHSKLTDIDRPMFYVQSPSDGADATKGRPNVRSSSPHQN